MCYIVYTVRGNVPLFLPVDKCRIDLQYYYITLYVFFIPSSRSLFSYMDRSGTCIILDKKYNIANSSCHFGSYGSIWTGRHQKNIIWTSNIFWVTDRSIYCHMTLSTMNYLRSIYENSDRLLGKIKT
jgi:hypothetical protein